MGKKSLRLILSIVSVCLLVSACSQGIKQPTGSISQTPVASSTAAPSPTPVSTTTPFNPTPSPSPEPTLKSIVPNQEFQAQVNWTLKSQSMAQAVSFISMQEGWIATESQLIHTQDGGKTWHLVSGIPDSFFRLDFVSPAHGWGLGGGGLYVTTDGGVTWKQQASNAFETSRISLPTIDFINDQVGWLVGPDGSLYQTTDGGVTWKIAAVPPIDPKILEIANYQVSFISPLKGWLIRAYGGGLASDLTLYKTQDGGKTWEQIAYGGLNKKDGTLPWYRSPDEIYFFDDTHGWFIGAVMNGDKFTADGGKTWQWLDGANNPGIGIGIHQIHMFTSLQGIANYNNIGGTFSLEKTEDGGNTWQRIFPPLVPEFNIQFIDLQHGFGMGLNGFPALLSTSDGGVIWQKVLDSEIYAQFIDPTYGWAICNHPNGQPAYGLCQTVDGGKTWQSIPGVSLPSDFHFFNALEGVMMDTSQNLSGTQDGGKTWKPVDLSHDKFPLRKDEGGWLRIAKARSYLLYHSMPGDSYWTQTSDSFQYFYPISAQVAFGAASDPKNGLSLIKTIDGGKTWNRIILGDVFSGRVSPYYFSFSDAANGWLMIGQCLLRTTDGGLTWNQILPSIRQ